MKSLIITLLFTCALTAFAQNEDKNTVFVGASYVRRNVELVTPNATTFRRDVLNDSVGFEVQWVHFPTKAPIGIGIEVGASFHSLDLSGTVSCGTGCTATTNGKSTVALAYGNYLVKLQPRKGSFRPYVKGTGGAARDDFGGKSFVNGVGLVGPDTTFTYGGGAGVDVRLKGKTFWRFGADYLNTGFGNNRQHNVKIVTGLVWNF